MFWISFGIDFCQNSTWLLLLGHLFVFQGYCYLMKLEGGFCGNKVSCCLKTLCQETVHFDENVGVLPFILFLDRHNLVIKKYFESIL